MRYIPTCACVCVALLGSLTPARSEDLRPGRLTPQKQESREAFFRTTLTDAYDAIGSHNAKWDADARAALQLAVQRSMSIEPDPDVDWEISVLSDRAAKAGCDDAAVLYFDMRTHASQGLGTRTAVLDKLPQAMFKSDYDASLKVLTAVRLAEFLDAKVAHDRPAMDRLAKAFYDNLPAMAAEPDFPEDQIAVACVDFTDRALTFYGDRKPMIDKIAAILAKASPDSALADLFQGLVYWNYSWDGPGPNGTGNERDDRHHVALDHMTAALAKEPHFAAASADMVGLNVDMGDVGQADVYFRRAIADDPDCRLAYHYKFAAMNTGGPRAVANLRALGRACIASNRWEGRIPFQLLRAQELIFGRRPNELLARATTDEQREAAYDWEKAKLYGEDPTMWVDLKSLYEGYLAYNPGAVAERVNYAKVALLANHPDVAAEQFEALDANHKPVFKGLIAQPDLRGKLCGALTERALIGLAGGDVKAAVADARRGIALTPRGSPAQWYAEMALWLAQTQAGDKAQADQDLRAFTKAQKRPAAKDWPSKVTAYFSDDVSEVDFFAAADASPAEVQNGNTCEAWYYAGKRKLIAGDKRGAADCFTACIARNVPDYIESKAAQAEMKLLVAHPE